MRRLKIFAKGNADVFDSLVVSRRGDRILWNGINEVLRERGLGALARVQHETSTAARGLVHPPAADSPLAACPESLTPHPLAIQASREVFETDADAIVLSLAAEIGMRQHRNLETGAYVYVNNWDRLDEAARDWLGRTHVLAEVSSEGEAFQDLTEIIARIRESSDVPILIYNVSFFAPGPITHCYLGLEGSVAARVRRFNLMLMDLSAQTGVSIVDVEGVAARMGLGKAQLGIHHFTAEGARCVAEEVVRVLYDYGLFDED